MPWPERKGPRHVFAMRTPTPACSTAPAKGIQRDGVATVSAEKVRGMQGSGDDRDSNRQGDAAKLTPRRVERERSESPRGGKNLGGQIGEELRAVFSVARVPHELDGLHELLNALELKCAGGTLDR